MVRSQTSHQLLQLSILTMELGAISDWNEGHPLPLKVMVSRPLNHNYFHYVMIPEAVIINQSCRAYLFVQQSM